MNRRKAQETINARLDAIVKVGYERLLERIDHVETDGVTVEGDGACNVEVQYFSISSAYLRARSSG